MQIELSASLVDLLSDPRSALLAIFASSAIAFLLGLRVARRPERVDLLDPLMAPIRESLDRVDAKLSEVEKERELQKAVLAEQLDWMASSHRRIESGTRDLVAALRSPSVRGRWGELQLRRTVEIAGMLPRCDFREQASLDEGRLRPDVIVHLAGGRTVVIDAKTPLEAYLTALEAESERDQRDLQARHAKQVRDHVTRLGAKRYWSALDATPEFVVLFLPGEAFFRAALEQDPELLEFAARQQVVLASPATLIGLLRAIAYGWQQAEVAENAAEISRLGRELHDRVANVCACFDRLGRRLGGAVAAYDQAMRALDQRVLVSARRLRELGVGGDDLASPEPLEAPPASRASPASGQGSQRGDRGLR